MRKGRIYFFWAVAYLCFCVSGGVRAQDIGKNLDSLFSYLALQNAFNGSVLVADRGLAVYEKAFGFANLETRQPIGAETMFELASVSKQFTAMAIMQLHEQNKLSYGDSLQKYFPELSYPGVTIRHLLTNTSGIPDFMGWTERISTSKINRNGDIIASMIKDLPKAGFKAGDTIGYSNTNYLLLAEIVAKVSGIAFGDYMDQNIFKPLGMSRTRVYAQRSTASKEADLAYGHQYDPLSGKFMTTDQVSAGLYQYYLDGVFGPYGISSTARDLLKWDQALYTEKLISFAGQEEAYKPFLLSNGKTSRLQRMPYGFAWMSLPPRDFAGRGYIHTGQYEGYQTAIIRYPDKTKTIIVLTNAPSGVGVLNIVQTVEKIIFGQPFRLPSVPGLRRSIVLAPEKLKAVTGVYTLEQAPQVKITISSESGKTYAQVSGQAKYQIYPESDISFFYMVVPHRIRFIRDREGVVRRLSYTSGEMLQMAVKQ